MKKALKIAMIVIAIILIILGIVLDGLLIKKQNENILSDEENQLNHLAQSIDRNIDAFLDYRLSLIAREMNYNYIQRAEKTWVYTGNSDDLVSRLYSSLIDSQDIADDVLVLRYQEPKLSVNREMNYEIEEHDYEDLIVSCNHVDGEKHILILSPVDEYGVQLGLVIDIREFYTSIISTDLAQDKWVLLLDNASEMMIHYQKYKVLADPIDAVTGATCGPDGIELMKLAQAENRALTEQYEYWDSEKKQEHVAYINIIPASESRNSIFAIGVAGQIDAKTSWMRTTTGGIIISAGMIMLGLIIIIWNFRLSSKKEKEQQGELEFLRDKNDEMSSLIEKHNELAHIDRLETIGTLTSSIAHEFNNVLTPVMAYSMMSLEKLPEDETEIAEYLEEIYNAAKRAKRIVSRLSDLSRKNTDKNFSDIDAKELIEKACESAAPAKPKTVSMEMNLAEGRIVANELQLHQMLLNFILNSFQAMGDNGGRLEIESSFSGDDFIIKVSDDGPGIPEDIQDKIFDPFFTTKGSGLGTGLGLAICKQAVEDHKGTITLVSEEGKGCSFIVILPRKI